MAPPSSGARGHMYPPAPLATPLHTTEPESVLTADDLNIHYAAVSTDRCYTTPAFRDTVWDNQPIFTEYRVFQILDRLRHTADGADRLPAWYLRLTAPVYSCVLSHLVNLSLLLLSRAGSVENGDHPPGGQGDTTGCSNGLQTDFCHSRSLKAG